MSVKLQVAIREGWKATQNDRFGEVLEIRFINTQPDGKEQIMFRYAPKLEDKAIWDKLFFELDRYDVKLKELRTITQMLNNSTYQSAGTCEKCPQ